MKSLHQRYLVRCIVRYGIWQNLQSGQGCTIIFRTPGAIQFIPTFIQHFYASSSCKTFERVTLGNSSPSKLESRKCKIMFVNGAGVWYDDVTVQENQESMFFFSLRFFCLFKTCYEFSSRQTASFCETRARPTQSRLFSKLDRLSTSRRSIFFVLLHELRCHHRRDVSAVERRKKSHCFSLVWGLKHALAVVGRLRKSSSGNNRRKIASGLESRTWCATLQPV